MKPVAPTRDVHGALRMPFDFDSLNERAQAILAQYDQKRAAMLPLLHLVQEKAGYVPPEGEAWVARQLDVAVAHVHEVVTFYTLYQRKPIGAYHVQVCTNMACWLRGCDEIVKWMKQKFGIEPGQTTPDGRVTLSEVECLCACERAPACQISTKTGDGKYYGPLTKDNVKTLLRDLA